MHWWWKGEIGQTFASAAASQTIGIFAVGGAQSMCCVLCCGSRWREKDIMVSKVEVALCCGAPLCGAKIVCDDKEEVLWW